MGENLTIMMIAVSRSSCTRVSNPTLFTVLLSYSVPLLKMLNLILKMSKLIIIL